MMMTIEEAIRKFGLETAEQNGVRGFRVLSKKPTAKEVAWLKENKPAILEVLDELEAKRAAQRAAWQKEEQAKKEARKQAILSGEKLIKVINHDGEYLSGYKVVGLEAECLEEIGLAKYVQGWGYHIPLEAIKALGESFTYAAAVEYMQPVKAANDAKVAQAAANRQAKFDEAKATGQPVVLRKWTVECNDEHEDCSLDAITEYAMPDGTVNTKRVHTY